MPRPKAENPRSTNLLIRVTPDELAEMKAAAKRAGVTMSDWARSLLFKAARKAPPRR